MVETHGNIEGQLKISSIIINWVKVQWYWPLPNFFHDNRKLAVQEILYCVQIFMSDNIDMVISAALLPVALLSAPILVAKKYVLFTISI